MENTVDQNKLVEVQEWFGDKNLPEILESLKSISDNDYARWRGQISIAGKAGGLFSAFNNKNLGGPRYQEIRRSVVESLETGDGYRKTDFILSVADGKVENVQPSKILRTSIDIAQNGSGNQKHLPGTLQRLANELCSPYYIRNLLMPLEIKGVERELAQLVILSEMVRLLMIKELNHALKRSNSV